MPNLEEEEPQSRSSRLTQRRAASTAENFTAIIWNSKDGDCECHMSSQLEDKRGADEMASCVFDWLMKLPEDVKVVVFYCDKCAGQIFSEFKQHDWKKRCAQQQQNLLCLQQRWEVGGNANCTGQLKLPHRKAEIDYETLWMMLIMLLF